MAEKMHKTPSAADWMLPPKLDPAGSEVTDLLARLRRSNRALERLRQALEGDEARGFTIERNVAEGSLESTRSGSAFPNAILTARLGSHAVRR